MSPPRKHAEAIDISEPDPHALIHAHVYMHTLKGEAEGVREGRPPEPGQHCHRALASAAGLLHLCPQLRVVKPQLAWQGMSA
jgi:hypothetical protein